MQLTLFLQTGGDKVAVMTTKCIQRLAKDLDHSWLEHFRSIDDREMATFPGSEAWIDNDCTTTPESSRSVSPYQEISAPRGPWHLEMAPLSSITPDENNQYYPARSKKFDKKEVPLKIWRQPSLTSKPQISQPRSFSMSDGETALKFGRNRLTSVPVLQEVHQQQKSPDLSELEEDSLFTAIFPEKVQYKQLLLQSGCLCCVQLLCTYSGIRQVQLLLRSISAEILSSFGRNAGSRQDPSHC